MGLPIAPPNAPAAAGRGCEAPAALRARVGTSSGSKSGRKSCRPRRPARRGRSLHTAHSTLSTASLSLHNSFAPLSTSLPHASGLLGSRSTPASHSFHTFFALFPHSLAFSCMLGQAKGRRLTAAGRARAELGKKGERGIVTEIFSCLVAGLRQRGCLSPASVLPQASGRTDRGTEGGSLAHRSAHAPERMGRPCAT